MLTVDVIPASLQSSALGVLFCHTPLQQRLQWVSQTLRRAEEEPGMLRHLLGAFRETHLTAVAWGEPLPGRTALLWGPFALDPQSTAGPLLISDLLERLEREGIQVLQSILDTNAQREPWLSTAGFLPPIDLLYLRSTDYRQANNVSELSFWPYTDEDFARFGDVIQRTYEGTQDVPQLNGVRAIEDVLEGYRQTGEFAAARWFRVCHAEREVGVLLLADHPQLDQLELVYMGLIPAVRGKGWGLNLVTRALHEASALGRKNLILAVDAENQPALELYQQAGLVPFDRRQVRLKILRRDPF